MAGSRPVGALLCGGMSRRMGRDKALLALGERTLLERALVALDSVCAEVRLCCGAQPRYAELGRSLLLDRQPEGGPLAGVEAALASLATHECLVVAPVDLPWLTPGVLEELVAARAAADADVACARSALGLEPLVSVWAARCLPAVQAALQRGERRMVAPMARLSDHGTLTLVEVTFTARSLARAFDNLNTPLDWQRAVLETEGQSDYKESFGSPQ